MSLNISNILTRHPVNQDAFDILKTNIGASKKYTKFPSSQNEQKSLPSFANSEYKTSPPSNSTGFFAQ